MMISYGYSMPYHRLLEESGSGERDKFGFDDPWVIIALVLLGILLLMVFVKLFNKYCCEVNFHMHALKQKIGLAN